MSTQNNVKWLSMKTPERRVTAPDGTVRTEKLSPIPFREKMLDPDGNVVDVSLATGATIRGFQNNMYGVAQRAAKIARGFLPYSECPYAKGYVASKKEKRCDGDDGLGGMKRGTCCEHIEKIAAARKAATLKREKARAERFATQNDRQIEIMMRQYAKDSADEIPATGAKSRMPG